MLNEEPLNGSDLESLDINNYYHDNKEKQSCYIPFRNICMCNTPYLIKFIPCCLSMLIYVSGCALSFYGGVIYNRDYDKSHNCNTTL